jgi:hypothetical protein
MKQKERDEQAKSIVASSSAAGAAKGAMAIAALEAAPKAEHAVLVSRTGINTSKGKPENPVAGRLIATWPLVDCSTETCDRRARWNIMFQTREVIKEGGSGKWGDDADPEEIIKYLCTVLHGKSLGVHAPGSAGQDLCRSALDLPKSGQRTQSSLLQTARLPKPFQA